MSTTVKNETPADVLTAQMVSLSPRKRRGLRFRGSLGIILVIVVWEVASLVIRDPVILPSVPSTVGILIHYLSHPYPSEGVTLWQDALVSLGRILSGFVLGSIAGITIGSIMASSRIIKDLVSPIIEVTRPLPPLAFIPLFIVWFGIGEASKVILVTIGVVPIMAIATLSALEAVPVELLHAGRVLGASPWHNLLHVRVRAALPAIITGMRIAMGISWTSIVAVEMIAATSGVGYVILQAGNYLVTNLVFTGIIIIAVLGLVLDSLLRLLARRVGARP